jgi:hypothetical protein
MVLLTNRVGESKDRMPPPGDIAAPVELPETVLFRIVTAPEMTAIAPPPDRTPVVPFSLNVLEVTVADPSRI